MAEEQRWQQQQPAGEHRLCANNNCGFFGNPTTLDLCSNCYKNYHRTKKHQIPKSKMVAFEKSLIGSESVSLSQLSSPSYSDPLVTPEEDPVSAGTSLVVAPAATTTETRPNRCAECRRRVGLTGFTCRCGTMFCGTHRYPELHGCTFDFKKMGKEAIAKANPVVKAEKLQKI